MAAAILRSTLTVEPPSREMNSLSVIFNQKCNFYLGILTFKGSLLSGALKLKRFFARNRQQVQTFAGQYLAFLDRRPPHSEFEGTNPPPQKGACINRNTTFEPLSVQFGPKLRPVGWPRKWKKNKKAGRRKSQNRYISPPCGRCGGAISHFDLHQI